MSKCSFNDDCSAQGQQSINKNLVSHVMANSRYNNPRIPHATVNSLVANENRLRNYSNLTTKKCFSQKKDRPTCVSNSIISECNTVQKVAIPTNPFVNNLSPYNYALGQKVPISNKPVPKKC